MTILRALAKQPPASPSAHRPSQGGSVLYIYTYPAQPRTAPQHLLRGHDHCPGCLPASARLVPARRRPKVRAPLSASAPRLIRFDPTDAGGKSPSERREEILRDTAVVDGLHEITPALLGRHDTRTQTDCFSGVREAPATKFHDQRAPRAALATGLRILGQRPQQDAPLSAHRQGQQGSAPFRQRHRDW